MQRTMTLPRLASTRKVNRYSYYSHEHDTRKKKPIGKDQKVRRGRRGGCEKSKDDKGEVFVVEREKVCQKIGLKGLGRGEEVLRDMEKAVGEQCMKLEINLGIKLQLSFLNIPDQSNHPRQAPPPVQTLREISEQPEKEDSLAALEDYWSCPQQSIMYQSPILRKHESARLLCDNYEKHELIYSVETLTPKLLREDLELHFSHV